MIRKTAASFGSVSHGTMRAEDLIPEFVYTLRQLRGSIPRNLWRDIQQWERTPEKSDNYELVDSLIDKLNEYAPPYAYFGAHPGDGSDYGFWPSEFLEDDFDGLRVNDTSEVPRDYRGEVLHISDHGNLTLYVATSRGLREVWSLV